jgi:nuclear protein localization family protein 4
MVASALGLEKVGWVFTTLNKDQVFMTSEQLRQAAKFQEDFRVKHPDGYTVSKFITTVVQVEDLEKH